MGSKAHLIPLSLTLTLMLIIPISMECQATGIGATPSQLVVTIDEGGTSHDTMYIINTGDTPTDYNAYADVNYSSWVSIEPNNFTLAPNANIRVNITFNVPLDTNGSYNFYIYIEGHSAGTSSNLGAGLKIPVTIHIQDTGDNDLPDNSSLCPWVWPILIIVLIAIIILIYHRVKNKQREGKNENRDGNENA